MNIWTFVLLGFLAHSCSGFWFVNDNELSDKVCSTVQNQLANNDGRPLSPIPVSDNAQVNPTARGYKGLNVTMTKGDNNTYTVNCEGPVIVTSKQTTGELVVGLNVQLTLSLGLVDGTIKLTQKTLKATTNILQSLTGVVQGLLGTLLQLVGGVLKNLLGKVEDSCKEDVSAQVTQALTGVLDVVNADLQQLFASLGKGGVPVVGGLLMQLPPNLSLLGQDLNLTLSLDLVDGMIPALLAYSNLPGKRTSPTADTLSLHG